MKNDLDNWITKEFERLKNSGDRESIAYLLSRPPCEVCRDPVAAQWHSEDYSKPYSFQPPATFAICNACHLRLHKRFNQPQEWNLFVLYLRTSGGYGREFTATHSIAQRREWLSRLASEEPIAMPVVRVRQVTGKEWWQHLSLDPSTKTSALARPRP